MRSLKAACLSLALLFAPLLANAQPIGLYTAAPTASGRQIPCALIGIPGSTLGCTPAQIIAAGGGALASNTVGAGAGLSGGGAISTNPVLAILFGTTAGTVAQGNDSRIVSAIPNTQYGTASVLGLVKPDGTSILNSSGAISVTPASVGALPIGGGTLTGALTLAADAASALQPVSLEQLQAYSNSQRFTASVVAVANINVSSPGATIDSYSLTSGQTVLLTGQSTQSQNGLYTFNGSSSALTRLTAASAWTQIYQGTIFITNGTVYANTGWGFTVGSTGTVGTTAITVTQVSAPGSYAAGTGLTQSGTTFSITNTAVSAGSYGSSTSVPALTVNAQGQITAASSNAIPTATSSNLGLAKPDGTTITASAGALSIVYGTGANTAAQGNDSRITGALQSSTASSTYTPLTQAATPSVLGLVKPDGTTITNSSGAISVTYGTSAGTAAQGNDSRITGACQTSGCTMTGLLSGTAISTSASVTTQVFVATGATNIINWTDRTTSAIWGWYATGGKAYLVVGGTTVMSIDTSGNLRTLGNIYQGVTP